MPIERSPPPARQSREDKAKGKSGRSKSKVKDEFDAKENK